MSDVPQPPRQSLNVSGLITCGRIDSPLAYGHAETACICPDRIVRSVVARRGNGGLRHPPPLVREPNPGPTQEILRTDCELYHPAHNLWPLGLQHIGHSSHLVNAEALPGGPAPPVIHSVVANRIVDRDRLRVDLTGVRRVIITVQRVRLFSLAARSPMMYARPGPMSTGVS